MSTFELIVLGLVAVTCLVALGLAAIGAVFAYINFRDSSVEHELDDFDERLERLERIANGVEA